MRKRRRFSSVACSRRTAPGLDSLLHSARRSSARAGVPAGIHIGDNYRADIEGAHAAGWRTVWITPDRAAAERPVADVIVGDIAAAAGWFESGARLAPAAREE